jgi:hypothetical protein
MEGFIRKGLLIALIIVFSITVLGATPNVAQLNYTPSPAIPGTTITVLAQIENNSSSSRENVIVTLDNNFPFSVVEENTINIGAIGAYGRALAEFTVYVDPNAENTTYLIPITVGADGDGIITTKKGIIVSGKEPNIKVISVSDEKLIPGQEKTLIFEIQNIGTSKAFDVIVELQEDRTVTTTGTVVEREITPLGPSLAYLAQLLPKQKENVEIKVSVNREAELKNYTLPIYISYRNASGTRTEDTSYIGIKVAGEVNIDAALKETTIQLIAGNTSQIVLELFNKGEGKAEYTVVEIETDFGAVEKPKQFIGSLEPNDVDSFKTNIKVDATTETKEGKIIVKISYQDTDAKNKIKTIEIPVNVYSIQDGAGLNPASPIGGIFILVILIIIVVVGWKKYKKKK